MIPGIEPGVGTHLFYLDGAGVLFSEATQELHLLNTTATAIWSLLEEGHDAASASEALREMYGLDAHRSRESVFAALAEWRSKGLLTGSPAAVPEGRPTARQVSTPSDPRAWIQPTVFEQRHYRILQSRFCVCYSSRAQMQMVHPILEHLQVPESFDEATTVHVVETMNRFVVYRNREVFDECARITGLAPIVKSLLWTTTVNEQEYFLDIHAGVIGDGSRCILLPAPSGSGKSTLTAALVHAGCQYFSDEVALLQSDSFRVFPLPLAIGIKTSGIDVLTRRFPLLQVLQIHERGDGKAVVYMPPPKECLPANDEPLPVAALIFPLFSPDSDTSMSSLAKGDALKRLMEECVAVPTRLDFGKVEGLVKWIARTPCMSLRYASTDEAVKAIRSVLIDDVVDLRPHLSLR